MSKHLLYFLLGFILAVALWQLEIVFIVATNNLSWGYNFGGLGDLGLELWQWRDVWYTIIFLSFIGVIAVENLQQLRKAFKKVSALMHVLQNGIKEDTEGPKETQERALTDLEEPKAEPSS